MYTIWKRFRVWACYDEASPPPHQPCSPLLNCYSVTLPQLLSLSPLCLSLSLSLLCLSLTVSLFSVPLTLSLCFSLTVFRFVSLSQSLSLPHSLCLSLSPYISLSLSLFFHGRRSVCQECSHALKRGSVVMNISCQRAMFQKACSPFQSVCVLCDSRLLVPSSSKVPTLRSLI